MTGWLSMSREHYPEVVNGINTVRNFRGISTRLLFLSTRAVSIYLAISTRFGGLLVEWPLRCLRGLSTTIISHRECVVHWVIFGPWQRGDFITWRTNGRTNHWHATRNTTKESARFQRMGNEEWLRPRRSLYDDKELGIFLSSQMERANRAPGFDLWSLRLEHEESGA